MTIPELQFRAQDLLQQSRMWVLAEQMRRIELLASGRQLGSLADSELGVFSNDSLGSLPPRDAHRPASFRRPKRMGSRPGCGPPLAVLSSLSNWVSVVLGLCGRDGAPC